MWKMYFSKLGGGLSVARVCIHLVLLSTVTFLLDIKGTCPNHSSMHWSPMQDSSCVNTSYSLWYTSLKEEKCRLNSGKQTDEVCVCLQIARLH